MGYRNLAGRITALTVILTLSTLFLPLSAQARSFDELFPGLDPALKEAAFSEAGFQSQLKKGEPLRIRPAPGSGLDLPERVMKKPHGFLAEALMVVPYGGHGLEILDAYNALSEIRRLKGRKYHSFTRKAYVPMFEDATRVRAAGDPRAIPDPGDAASVPEKETVYIKVDDVNFGNCFYRAEITPSPPGLLYNLTNNEPLTYIIFTVMKKENFSAFLYMEPLDEGMLVYSAAGAEVSSFIASKIDIPSAIGKRLGVLTDWIAEGLRERR